MIIKIRLKRTTHLDRLTLTLAGENVRFDAYTLESGPWGEATLILFERGLVVAIIGSVPDDPEAPPSPPPKSWGESLSKRYRISPDLLFIGSAPMVVPILTLLSECGHLDDDSLQESLHHLNPAPAPKHVVTGYQVYDRGNKSADIFELTTETLVNQH